jgi:hypothetical protein
MVRVRFRELAILSCVAAVAAAACSKSQSTAVVGPKPGERAVLATFTGQFDAATGKLTITPDPGSAPGALSVMDPYSDGSLTYNPPDTFQIANDFTTSPPGYGTDTGCEGSVARFYGDVQIRNFFRYQDMQNVYLEITGYETDHVGCLSDPAVAGVSATNGLWSYGTLARAGQPGDRATKRWSFRYQTTGSFWFRGRVMATLSRPVTTAVEFDWVPSNNAGGQNFVQTANTTAHLRWNGTSWLDLMGKGITFQPVGSPTSTFSMVPGAPYASGLTTGNYWIADAAHGGNAIDTSGNFTVCAKFKPGLHPYDDTYDVATGTYPNKTIVAKGVPEDPDPIGSIAGSHEGWSLMQMHEGYCFHYRTEAEFLADPTDQTPHMSPYVMYKHPATHPELYAYDYICGGRNGATIQVGTMLGVGPTPTVDPYFASSGASLPLVIGANANGAHQAKDAGVYEIIFDRRGVSYDVMSEIVEAAEGTWATKPAKFLPQWNPAETYAIGPDGNSYLFPAVATLPLTDLTGQNRLPAGTMVRFQDPITSTSTSVSGFCVGAEIEADGVWSTVQGGVFRYDLDKLGARFGNGAAPGPWMKLGNRGHDTASGVNPRTWVDQSRHTIMICGQPAFGFRLWTDGVADSTDGTGDSIPDLSTGQYLDIGVDTAGTNLTNARIRRVWACPSYDASLCP